MSVKVSEPTLQKTLPTPPEPAELGQSPVGQVDLEDGLTIIGFVVLNVGVGMWAGLAWALIVGGGILFGLGLGLAIWKGTR